MDTSDDIAAAPDKSEQHQLACRFAEQAQETTQGASQLEAIFEAMADPVVVYDDKGNILQANAAFRELLAVNIQPDFVSGPLHERMSRVAMRSEDGQLLPEEQWPMTRILRGEVLSGAHTIDVTFTTLDGRTIQVSASGAPVRDQQGQIVGCVAIYRDVTERRHLERRSHEALNALLAMAEALVQAPADVERLTENTPPSTQEVALRLVELIRSILGCQRVSITTVDPETGAWHSLAVVGLPPEQAQHWYARRPGFHLSERFAGSTIDSRLHANEVVVLDLTQAPLSDRPNPYGISTILLAPMMISKQLVGVLSLDHGGTKHVYTQEELGLAGAVAKLAALVIERERLLQERTEAQANALALQEANRRMDNFLAMASHELKTPLTSVKGNIQLAKRLLKRVAGWTSDSTRTLTNIQELLDRIERQVEVQNRLAGDLLDVSRIQENKLRLRLKRCDLATIVRDVVQEMRSLVPKRSITLTLPTQEIVPVIADEDRIGQVVTNYLTNGLKYSAADQPVEVSLQVNESGARVAVRDYGRGLPAAEQERIWERFYRVEGIETQNGSGGGLGLGLHICRTILEQHQGQFGVHSAPGQGATFWFALPLAGA